jgi:AraC-like DNA-binding protein
LGEVLQLLQLTGVLYCRAELTEPWGVELPALQGVIMVEVVTSGHCWIELEGKEPTFMPQGSLALIPRGTRHKLRSSVDAKTALLSDISIEMAGDRFEIMRHGGGGCLTNITYCGVRFDHVLADRLIGLLPDILHIHTLEDDNRWLDNTVQFISREAQQMLPGNETVITRLADILVIQAIRSWIQTVQNEECGWIAALRDVQIGKALANIHRQPEKDWSVASLAKEIGMSRSGFSARFSALVGEPVLQYLTNLRMQLARRQILQTSDSLAKIAQQIGYNSEPAFSRAFKRVMGTSPGAVRKGGSG